MNRNRGTDGTWTTPELSTLIEEGDVTIEEAAALLAATQYQLSGFWDEKQNQACRAGKPMLDIGPCHYPRPTALRTRNGTWS